MTLANHRLLWTLIQQPYSLFLSDCGPYKTGDVHRGRPGACGSQADVMQRMLSTEMLSVARAVRTGLLWLLLLKRDYFFFFFFFKGTISNPLVGLPGVLKYAAESYGDLGACWSITCDDGWGLWDALCVTRCSEMGALLFALAEGSLWASWSAGQGQGDRKWSVPHEPGEVISARDYYYIATPAFFWENGSEEDAYSLSCFLCVGDASEIWECPWFCQN